MNNTLTPANDKENQEKNSAYRSYKKREMQKSAGQQIKLNESLGKFSDTIELLNKNKLNRANAFQNRLLDVTETLFTEFLKDENKESLWPKYSTVIEACGKIYGLCVDSIHSDTIGILQGLNRTGVIQENEETALDKKKKKKIIGGINTLDEESNITTGKFEKYEEYDPFFKSIASKFDANCFKGLLLNEISCSNALDLVFVSELLKQEILECSDFKISIPAISLNSLNLNLGENIQKFSNLPFREQDQNESIFLSCASLSEVEVESGSDFYEETENEEKEIEAEVDKRFLEGNLELAKRISQIADDDYKFFSKPSAWAGFNYAKGIICASDKISEKKPRVKKVKPQDTFKLEKDFDFNLDKIFPKSKVLKINEKLKKTDSTIRLPEDFRFSMKRFTKLFTKPYTFIKSIRGKEVESKSFSVDAESELKENFSNIPQPETEVQQNPYLKSKQVNIKLLKDTISAEILNTKKCSFRDVLDILPNNLPQKEVSQLSVHVCFISLLHLANENDYYLEKTGECDFQIAKNKWILNHYWEKYKSKGRSQDIYSVDPGKQVPSSLILDHILSLQSQINALDSKFLDLNCKFNSLNSYESHVFAQQNPLLEKIEKIEKSLENKADIDQKVLKIAEDSELFRVESIRNDILKQLSAIEVRINDSVLKEITLLNEKMKAINEAAKENKKNISKNQKKLSQSEENDWQGNIEKIVLVFGEKLKKIEESLNEKGKVEIEDIKNSVGKFKGFQSRVNKKLEEIEEFSKKICRKILDNGDGSLFNSPSGKVFKHESSLSSTQKKIRPKDSTETRVKKQVERVNESLEKKKKNRAFSSNFREKGRNCLDKLYEELQAL